MKRRGWVLTSVATALLAALVVPFADWSPDPVACRADAPPIIRVADPNVDDPSLNWRQSQPRHWRYLMLNR